MATNLKITFIDHYDSFSLNVIDWLSRYAPIGWDIDHLYFDDSNNIRGLINQPTAIVISPGPNSPDSYLSTLPLVESFMGHVPILGICLGFQMIGKIAGGTIVSSRKVFHGTTRRIFRCNLNDRLMSAMPNEFVAMSYNSLSINFLGNKSDVEVSSMCEFGDLQSITVKAKSSPTIGVQFHPESFLSVNCGAIAQNFWKIVTDPNSYA